MAVSSCLTRSPGSRNHTRVPSEITADRGGCGVHGSRRCLLPARAGLSSLSHQEGVSEAATANQALSSDRSAFQAMKAFR